MRELYELLLTYLGGIWRYRWYMLLVAWLVSIVGWGVVYQLPDKYRASAKVHVDTQSMLQPLLRGLTISTNTRQRVQLVTRTLLSRPNLEKLARMTDLDLTATTAEEMERLLDELGDLISISTTREQDIYTISYPNEKPQVAKRVVQSLLTIFVESTLGESREETDSAQQFVAGQIKVYEVKLQEAELRLAEFKRKNIGMMPGSSRDYYGQLQTAVSDLKQAQLSLREVQNQRNQIKRQLEDDEDAYLLYNEFMPGSGSALDMRIQGLTERMDELLLRYTEKHPDVVEIRRLINDLEQQSMEEQALMDELDMGPMDNPVYQQMKMQLNQAVATVASMRTRVSEYQQRVNHLQEMVDTIPKVEAELKRLDRDYGVYQKNYQALLSRRESVKMSEQAEISGDQIRFRIIEPPRVPLAPSEPNRPLLMTGVLLAGFAAGVGLALLLYLLRPTIDNPRTVMEVLGRPVLGAISLVHDEGWVREQRTAIVAFSVAGLGLFVAYTIVIAFAGVDYNIAEITSAVMRRG